MVDQTSPDTPDVPVKPTVLSKGRRKKLYTTRRAKLKIGHILSESFSMYFANFPLFTMILLLILSPLLILLLVYQSDFNPLLRTLLQILLGQIATASIIYGVFRHIRKDSAGIGRCLSIGLARLFPLIGVAILTGMAAGAISIIPIVLVAALAAGGIGILAFPLMLLACIPGTWIYLVLYAAAPCVVVERVGVMEALRRSQVLTRGNRLRIFAVILVIGVLQFILGAILGLILVNSGVGETATQVCTYLLTILTASLSAVATSLVYYRLKIEVEGLDEMELASVFD